MPYLKCFVPNYHNWMQDEDLLHLTSSEKLTIEEEYQNQIDWFKDKSKTTFIIFLKKDEQNSNSSESNDFPTECQGYNMINILP